MGIGKRPENLAFKLTSMEGSVRINLLGGLLVTLAYGLLLEGLEQTGIYSLQIGYFPGLAREYWLVFLCASLASAVVLRTLRPINPAPRRLLVGALLGAPLGPACAALAVLLWLCSWQISALFGLTQPWKYGFGCLLQQWWSDVGSLMLLSLPLSLPLGACAGAFLGWLGPAQVSSNWRCPRFLPHFGHYWVFKAAPLCLAGGGLYAFLMGLLLGVRDPFVIARLGLGYALFMQLSMGSLLAFLFACAELLDQRRTKQ